MALSPCSKGSRFIIGAAKQGPQIFGIPLCQPLTCWEVAKVCDKVKVKVLHVDHASRGPIYGSFLNKYFVWSPQCRVKINSYAPFGCSILCKRFSNTFDLLSVKSPLSNVKLQCLTFEEPALLLSPVQHSKSIALEQRSIRILWGHGFTRERVLA